MRSDATDAPAAPADATPDTLTRRLAWATLGFTVAVILGGAVVRATDSGAGCGESWPRCDGHLIPVSPGGATIIEFSHRLMSAALGVALISLGIAIVRRHLRINSTTGFAETVRTTASMAVLPSRYASKSSLERAFGWAVVFFFGEVIIGAVLVLFGWVGEDASVGRVVAVSLHLVNTFLLLGALTLVVYFAGNRDRLLEHNTTVRRVVLAGIVVMLVVGASGALNALSDTLFPADSLLEGIRYEFGATAPLLVQLRILHPVIAIVGGGTIFLLAQSPALAAERTVRLRRTVMAIIGVQIVVGLVNVALLTPLETQVLHLLLADTLWIAWVWLGATALDVSVSETARVIA